MVYKSLIGLSFVMASLVSVSANAALIDGTLQLAGGWTPIDINADSADISVATGIDFTTDQSIVVASTGDIATYTTPFVSFATMTDFQFNPLDPNPVNLWSVGGFTFTMNNVNIDLQDGAFLNLSGNGTITGNGFEATQGIWTFSGQTADDINFSWSSSNNTIVPVPAAVWLFGTGLLGLVGVARRRA